MLDFCLTGAAHSEERLAAVTTSPLACQHGGLDQLENVSARRVVLYIVLTRANEACAKPGETYMLSPHRPSTIPMVDCDD